MQCFRRRSNSIGWIPHALQLPALLSFIVLDLAIVVCLIVLSVWSSQHNGFATIGSQSVSLLSVSWNLGLLWTTLPVLVFRLLGIYWEWITSPISQRQPYVDLLQDSGAPARKSVLLDYLAVPIFWRWCTALRNKHFLVSACSLLTLIMSIVVSALSARLFAVRNIPLTSNAAVRFNTAYNDSALDSEVDWVPVLDTVSSVLVHNGGRLGWTDDQYAFKPYQVQGSVNSGDVVTARTDAYSAYLNCSTVSNYQLTLNDVRLSMTGNDRGCSISQNFVVDGTQNVYFAANSITTCSADAWYGRLVFTAARYSNSSSTKVTDVSVLSCISNYRKSTGDLRIASSGSSSAPTIQDFQVVSTDNTRLPLWLVFEQAILSATYFNPKVFWSTPVFGSVILYYAQKLGGSQYLTPKILERAISDVFSSVFLTGVAQNGFAPLATPTTAEGQVSRLTERLCTVYGVVYVIVVILVLSLLTALYTIVHVNTHPSILEEEPKGLLAHAAILDKSPLLDVAAELRGQDGGGTEAATKGKFKNTWWGGLQNTSRPGWKVTQLR